MSKKIVRKSDSQVKLDKMPLFAWLLCPKNFILLYDIKDKPLPLDTSETFVGVGTNECRLFKIINNSVAAEYYLQSALAADESNAIFQFIIIENFSRQFNLIYNSYFDQAETVDQQVIDNARLLLATRELAYLISNQQTVVESQQLQLDWRHYIGDMAWGVAAWVMVIELIKILVVATYVTLTPLLAWSLFIALPIAITGLVAVKYWRDQVKQVYQAYKRYPALTELRQIAKDASLLFAKMIVILGCWQGGYLCAMHLILPMITDTVVAGSISLTLFGNPALLGALLLAIITISFCVAVGFALVHFFDQYYGQQQECSVAVAESLRLFGALFFASMAWASISLVAIIIPAPPIAQMAMNVAIAVVKALLSYIVFKGCGFDIYKSLGGRHAQVAYSKGEEYRCKQTDADDGVEFERQQARKAEKSADYCMVSMLKNLPNFWQVGSRYAQPTQTNTK